MKREQTTKQMVRICDLCEKNRASYTQCKICGCDVCDSCAGYFVAGVGETDGYLVCNRASCREKAVRAARKCDELRDRYAEVKSRLYQDYQARCIAAWNEELKTIDTPE